MSFVAWLSASAPGQFLLTMLVAMVPVIELRGAIPFGVALGLGHWPALLASVIGNLIPVPFILLFIRRIFQLIRRHIPKLDHMVTRLETRAHTKGQLVRKYAFLGLFVLVAIPLPGTGAWTGSLVAAILDIRMKKALPAIAAGVLAAGVLVSIITFGVTALV